MDAVDDNKKVALDLAEVNGHWPKEKFLKVQLLIQISTYIWE